MFMCSEKDIKRMRDLYVAIISQAYRDLKSKDFLIKKEAEDFFKSSYCKELMTIAEIPYDSEIINILIT